jgi:hypothetical protein
MMEGLRMEICSRRELTTWAHGMIIPGIIVFKAFVALTEVSKEPLTVEGDLLTNNPTNNSTNPLIIKKLIRDDLDYAIHNLPFCHSQGS